MLKLLQSRAKEEYIVETKQDLLTVTLFLRQMTDVKARLMYNNIISKHPDIKHNIDNPKEKLWATCKEDEEEIKEMF